MAGQSYAMFGWSWTDVNVLGSHVFGQACGFMNKEPLLVFDPVTALIFVGIFGIWGGGGKKNST